MGLFYSEDPMIVAEVILTRCQHVTDRQTDLRWLIQTALLCWHAVKTGCFPGEQAPWWKMTYGPVGQIFALLEYLRSWVYSKHSSV